MFLCQQKMVSKNANNESETIKMQASDLRIP